MKTKTLLFIGLIVFGMQVSAFGQEADWRSLVPLKSDRKDVEKILGNPGKYFDTSGDYRTPLGKFYVWYAQGGCEPAAEGRQWNVSASKLTQLLFYPAKALPLEKYVTNMESVTKKRSPINPSRFFYSSLDESVTYETIPDKDIGEFVYSIVLEPAKDLQHLLCKK